MHLQIEAVRVMRAVLHHLLLLSLLENSFALKLTQVKAALSPAQYKLVSCLVPLFNAKQK